MAIMSDAFWSNISYRKKYGEILQVYTTRFKTSTEILKSHMEGPLILEKYVNTMEGYEKKQSKKISTMVKQYLESLFAYLYLDNLDHDQCR